MAANPSIEISVVVPVFNEESCFPELYRRLKEAVSSITEKHELLFVNDGSKDNTLSFIKQVAAADGAVRYLSFSRNFGHQNAILAGIQHASGNNIVLIDGDLQDPPELIPELYAKLKEGYHVVYAKRISREGESFMKKFTARLFYRLLKKIISIDIPLDTGDFRIISRKVANALKSMPETNRFLRGQISWLGFKQTYVSYHRKARLAGDTKFTLRKMLRFAFDGITSFSNYPLQIASHLGLIVSVIAFILIIYALYAKFILDEVVNGWTSLMVSVMFIGGVQLLCIGIIGEYLSRIGQDVKKRPAYIVEDTNVPD